MAANVKSNEELKKMALARLDKFQEECKENGVPPLAMTEHSRLKSYFMNTFLTTYGEKMESVPFDTIISDLMGSGIGAIETYIITRDDDFLNGLPDNEPFMNLPAEEITESDPVSDPVPVPVPAEKESPVEKMEKPAAKEKLSKSSKKDKSSSSASIIWQPTTSTPNQIKKLKKKRDALIRQMSIMARQLQIYHNDLAIIHGLIDYSKKKNKAYVYNGLELVNQPNVLHAALEMLVKELERNNYTECFENIRRYQEMYQNSVADFKDMIDEIDQQIEDLQK